MGTVVCVSLSPSDTSVRDTTCPIGSSICPRP
jgi:hypothetical protein